MIPGALAPENEGKGHGVNNTERSKLLSLMLI